MSLTRIGSIGINTGIAFAGVTTITTLNTANDALSIGATVNVGSGITLGASGDIFATGVSTVTTLKVGSGVTVSSDGDVFFTGIATGNGSGLTALNASNISSGTVPTARLGSGTASSSTFLRGDSTFQTVSTDLVSDTTPQLGGNLDVNTKNILFGDSSGSSDDRLTFGAGIDLSIFHDGTHSQIKDASSGELIISGSIISLNNAAASEYMLKGTENGSLELYYNNSKKFETTSGGVKITGVLTSSITSGQAVSLADNAQIHFGTGDDLKIYHDGSHSYIQDSGTGDLTLIASKTVIGSSNNAEVCASFIENGKVELYYDNVAKFETSSSGVQVKNAGADTSLFVTGADGYSAQIQFLADNGDDYADYSRIYKDQSGGNLHIQNYAGGSWENNIVCSNNGSVELYEDNSKRFETDSDGVVVVNGSENLNLHTNRFIVQRDETFYFDQNNTGNSFIFRVSDSSALDTSVIRLNSNGTMYNTCRSSSTTNITLRKGNNSADGIDYVQARANNNDLKFVVEGDGDVKNANNSYGSTSDSKLKENIVDANSQWADIKAVKVRNFNFISDSAKTKMIGVVAQELETVSAGLVSESIDRDPDTGADLGTTTKDVKYSILYMKSVKALQEAMTRIETLEAKVAALEG